MTTEPKQPPEQKLAVTEASMERSDLSRMEVLMPIDIDALRNLTTNGPIQTETAGDFMRRIRDQERY